MKAREIQIRLLAAVIGLSAVFFVVIGAAAVREISALTRAAVTTQALDLVALRAADIERFMAERGRVASTMLASPQLRDFFKDYQDYRRPLAGDREYQRVLRLFQAVIAADPTIASGFFATEATGEYFREDGRVERLGYLPKTRWWWAEAIARDRLYVSPPGPDAGTGDVTVTVQTTVRDDDGTLLGIGGIDVLVGTLGALVGEITYRGVGDAFLVDEDGQIIYFPRLELSGEGIDRFATPLADIDRLAPDSSGFAALRELMARPEPGLHPAMWQGQPVIVVHTPVSCAVPDFAWTLGLMVPEEVITSAISRARLATALAVLLAVLAITGATLLVVNKITSQLREEDRRKAEILAEANVKLLEADRMKSQFLATMSHELRTPLNSIIGFSEVLESRLGDQIGPTYRKFLKNINSSGEHLLHMISDILDLSKVEAGRMDIEPEPIDVTAAVEGVSAVVQGMARERLVVLEVEAEANLPRLEADLVRFKQILFNLLSNAVKFSPPSGVVTTVVRRLDEVASPLALDSIELAVVDRGPGIAAKYHEMIFEEFRQIESGAHHTAGTGLGLALVKRLVELHNGVVRLDSIVGEGSTFRVILPRRFRGADHTGSPPAVVSAPPAGRSVLVVEDDTQAFETMSRSLAAAGFVPERSRDGSDAVELAVRLAPAVIVLDIILPKSDGWEILRALRQRQDTAKIPVIMVSVLPNHELGVALGADAYFTKPVDRGRLVEKVAELAVASAPEPARVLLVDDDRNLHDLVTDALADGNYTLLHAYSGAEGLAAARAETPNLVILDLMMDGMDGFEVARELKLDPRTREVPIVVLTASQPSRAERERLKGKIEALVSKGASVGGPDLIPVINQVLIRCGAREPR